MARADHCLLVGCLELLILLGDVLHRELMDLIEDRVCQNTVAGIVEDLHMMITNRYLLNGELLREESHVATGEHRWIERLESRRRGCSSRSRGRSGGRSSRGRNGSDSWSSVGHGSVVCLIHDG